MANTNKSPEFKTNLISGGLHKTFMHPLGEIVGEQDNHTRLGQERERGFSRT